MALIDRTGTFRGGVVDAAVSVTRNGYPQFVIQLRAVEYFDEEEGEWIDWSEVVEDELTAYQVLFDGKDRKTLNCEQIEKIFNWDGLSFQTLNDADFTQIRLQFRVAENTYEEKTSLQVEWLDVYDAVPGRSVRKLDAGELKTLQGRYSAILKQTSNTPTKVAKAPAASPPKAPAKSTKQAALPPKAPTTSELPDVPAGECTKQEAWDTCVELKDKKVTDEKLSGTWLSTIAKVAGTKSDTKITPEEWFQIKEIVLAETAVF